MKKNKLLVIIITFFAFTLSTYALKTNFNFDFKKLSFNSSGKKSDIVDSFNDDYKLDISISKIDADLENEIKQLTKKTTYLLLGDSINKTETSEEYYKRHQEYLNLRYNPEVPKDPNTHSGLDEESIEYKDDIVSGLSVSGMFNKINELGIIYNSYGNIRVNVNNDLIISSITLNDVTIKEENADNPLYYKNVNTNITIHYYFKKLNNEYKLYYLFMDELEDLSNYFDEIESNESNNKISIMSYESPLNSIYNFDKLNNLTDEELNKIYNNNLKNIVYIYSYYNNKIVANFNGVFINDGLIVTSFSLLEKSLINGQNLYISDLEGKIYELDGVVTVNQETDIAVLKTTEKSNTSIILGENKNIEIEDLVITLSSKTGISLVLQKGILISNDGYLQTSIPLELVDAGSPLFDINGNVIGLNTNKSINSTTSLAINSSVLKNIKLKFENMDFNSITSISFEKIKEKYYYTITSDEKNINNVPKNKWNEFKKIGNLENSIELELVKASYKDNILSLRYKNEVYDYISSMQLISIYKKNLVKDGFKEIVNNSKKSVYENEKYQIIIMDEFNYLIIVMVEL